MLSLFFVDGGTLMGSGSGVLRGAGIGCPWCAFSSLLCQRTVSLLSPKQLSSLSSSPVWRAYLEESLSGVPAWWIGLADFGHEGEWVWQVGLPHPFEQILS